MNIKSIYKPTLLGLSLSVVLFGGFGVEKAKADTCNINLMLVNYYSDPTQSPTWNDSGVYQFSYSYYDNSGKLYSLSQADSCGPGAQNTSGACPTASGNIPFKLAFPVACSNLNRFAVTFSKLNQATPPSNLQSGIPEKQISGWLTPTNCSTHNAGTFSDGDTVGLSAKASGPDPNNDFDYGASNVACNLPSSNNN